MYSDAHSLGITQGSIDGIHVSWHCNVRFTCLKVGPGFNVGPEVCCDMIAGPWSRRRHRIIRIIFLGFQNIWTGNFDVTAVFQQPTHATEKKIATLSKLWPVRSLAEGNPIHHGIMLKSMSKMRTSFPTRHRNLGSKECAKMLQVCMVINFLRFMVTSYAVSP